MLREQRGEARWGWGSRFLNTKPWEAWASLDGMSRWASGVSSRSTLGVPACLSLQPPFLGALWALRMKSFLLTSVPWDQMRLLN